MNTRGPRIVRLFLPLRPPAPRAAGASGVAAATPRPPLNPQVRVVEQCPRTQRLRRKPSRTPSAPRRRRDVDARARGPPGDRASDRRQALGLVESPREARLLRG